ncbi:FAD/FMN-containing dehydrogenase [Pseudomonas sp. CFBP 13727]|uniref:FAD/FMN-containing dehydrogenase n=1 Tax=Pseudomonas sp. CFBP 13727 TaxID=2775295 RepID=UPI001782F996|nr:FAD/FMN-containing dehydrogenase [Pseudomonas sp. CFBP 13727]MBD8622204.1 FAD/FMN-containing dehydrogenase [Pseudomonas sp. CFBP 13727]
MKYCCALLLSFLSLTAQATEIGERLGPWTLLDQFEQPYSLSDQTQLIIVARSMDAAQLMGTAMEKRPKDFLESRHAAYIADIEHMPSVAKWIAIPGMKKLNYRILLDEEGRVAPRYNGDRETVQWLELKDGVVVDIKTFNDPQQLASALSAR